jgi:hypothetical protein
MEDDLNFLENGRQHHCLKMEDDLFFSKMEDDEKFGDELYFKVNPRRPQVNLAYLALASLELGIAQPQLVCLFSLFCNNPV